MHGPINVKICDHLLSQGTFEEHGPNKWGPLRGENPSSQTTDTSYECLRLQ